MKRIRIQLGILILVWWTAVSGVVPGDPQVFIKETADSVTARIKGEREALRKDSARLHTLVDELIVPHFDFARMSQWVLGKYWRGSNENQRSRFIEEFQRLLVRTYAHALLEYADREMRYLPPRTEPRPNMVTVRSEVEQPGSSAVPINYRVHIKDAEWKVFDVSVDGVSLVSTYRASFASEIRKSGIDGLIKSLETKNAK